MVHPNATAVKASRTGLCFASDGAVQRVFWLAMLSAHVWGHNFEIRKLVVVSDNVWVLDLTLLELSLANLILCQS